MQYMKFDDRDKAALRTLDGSFTFSSDGTTATVTMEVEIVRLSEDNGAQLRLKIKFPAGGRFDVLIPRSHLLERLDIDDKSNTQIQSFTPVEVTALRHDENMMMMQDHYERAQQVLRDLLKDGYPEESQLAILHMALCEAVSRNVDTEEQLREGIEITKNAIDEGCKAAFDWRTRGDHQ